MPTEMSLQDICKVHSHNVISCKLLNLLGRVPIAVRRHNVLRNEHFYGNDVQLIIFFLKLVIRTSIFRLQGSHVWQLR